MIPGVKRSVSYAASSGPNSQRSQAAYSLCRKFESPGMLLLDDTIEELTSRLNRFSSYLATLLFGDRFNDFSEHSWKLDVSEYSSNSFANTSMLPEGRRRFWLRRQPACWSVMPSAKGSIGAVDHKIQKVAVSFDEVNENISFDIDCTVKLDVFLQQRTIDGKQVYPSLNLFSISRNYNLGDTSMQFSFPFRYLKEIPVPLKLLRLWAIGGLKDPDQGIAIEQYSRGQWIRYQIHDEVLYGPDTYMRPKYTMAFINWFRRGGESNVAHIFGLFRSTAWLSTYDYNTIMQKLRLVESIVAPPRSPATIQEVKQKAAIVSKALDISKKDRKKLRTIRDYEGRSFSYSKWAELLQFNSKGAVPPFFKRMEEGGLIVVRKGDDEKGTHVNLTPDGHKVLAAINL